MYLTDVLFDIDRTKDSAAELYTDPAIEAQSEVEPSGKYAVVLHNDAVNGVEFVTRVIKSVFGYPSSKAIWLMLKAHFSGSAMLWSGSYNKAIAKKNRMTSFGPDPATVHKGASALTVSVELQA